MAVEERRSWIMLVVAVVSYAAYLCAVLSWPEGVPLEQAPYAAALLWSVGLSIVVTIAAGIAVAVASGEEGRIKDQRDREIHRFGEYVGLSFVVMGALTALGLAMAEVKPFWIANAIYLSFVLSSVLGSTVKLVSYRLGFHPW
ncbi:hypothetical protein AB4039_06255 [Streptomyces sp. M-16]|uniref:hypothetical protein n=1 Tax=Streptomyces sp. M-16 TaxID=3233040 RepID=UPI003F980340